MKKFSIIEQGFRPIAIFFALAVVFELFISDFLGGLFLILTIATIWIYRKNNHKITKDTNHILSPIDGKIQAIDFDDKHYYIYIDVNLCNEHILKAPVKGDMKILSYKNGTNLDSYSFKARKLNNQATIQIANIQLYLLSGVCNNKISIKKKEKVKQGKAIGLFFQGTIIMQIPKELNLKVNIADKINYANIIATLK